MSAPTHFERLGLPRRFRLDPAELERNYLARSRTVHPDHAGNARAKMAGLQDGFVKLFCRPASGIVVGGVVVAPKASELILPIAMAVENHLSVDQLAHTITIYPSLSGSLTEAARQLMQHEFD